MTIDESADELLIDRLTTRLDSLQLFRATNSAEASALLESFGTEGTVEAEMVQEVATLRALEHPSRFEDAHRRVMRALEVYDRNGPRAIPMKNVPGWLQPSAAYGTKWCTRAIVRKYQQSVTGDIRQLYALREASASPGSKEQQMLRRARKQVDEIRTDLAKNPIPLPAFIGVGALLSSTLSVVRRGLSDDVGRLLVALAFVVIGLASFWCVTKGAAVARRRTRIALDEPLHALWEVVGRAGAVTADTSRRWAVNATMVLIAVWVALPIAVALAVNRF